MGRSIKSVLACLTNSRDVDLISVELSRAQKDLIGKGYSGPPVNLAGVDLTKEQKAHCLSGLDEQQLQMIKAQVTVRSYMERSCNNVILELAKWCNYLLLSSD